MLRPKFKSNDDVEFVMTQEDYEKLTGEMESQKKRIKCLEEEYKKLNQQVATLLQSLNTSSEEKIKNENIYLKEQIKNKKEIYELKLDMLQKTRKWEEYERTTEAKLEEYEEYKKVQELQSTLAEALSTEQVLLLEKTMQSYRNYIVFPEKNNTVQMGNQCSQQSILKKLKSNPLPELNAELKKHIDKSGLVDRPATSQIIRDFKNNPHIDFWSARDRLNKVNKLDQPNHLLDKVTKKVGYRA
jgi:hypothetical protein